MELIRSVVRQVFGDDKDLDDPLKPVGGGCINNTGVFGYKGQNFFLKWNQNAHELFEKEKLGLELLTNQTEIEIPNVIGQGIAEDFDFLCLEFIEKGISTKKYWRNFGENLANLHKISNEKFGLHFENHIGRLPQTNEFEHTWIDFFINRRLEPQLKLAQRQNLIESSLLLDFELLYRKLENYFPVELPALLHGDLWSGNIMASHDNKPYIFDPAVYYGHREAELAFTHMFGGFDRIFYESYQSTFPLQPEFSQRIDLYNLYPLLVHLNLFGMSYLQGIQDVLRRFV